MSPSRPLTSQRTYLKSTTSTLRSTCRFPTQVRWCSTTLSRPDFVFKVWSSVLYKPAVTDVSVVFCRGKVSVCELQRAAGKGRRPSPLSKPGRLQEEEGADLMQPIHHPQPTLHVWMEAWVYASVCECVRVCVWHPEEICLNVDTTDCLSKHRRYRSIIFPKRISLGRTMSAFLLFFFVILHNHTHTLSCAFYAVNFFTPLSDSWKFFLFLFFLNGLMDYYLEQRMLS